MTFTWGQGGNILYGPDQLGALKNATSDFSKVTDTKAALVTVFVYSSGEVCTLRCSVSKPRFLCASQVVSSVILFYNGPQAPSGIFDAFLRIPNLQQDIKTRSYADLVKIQASPAVTPVGFR